MRILSSDYITGASDPIQYSDNQKPEIVILGRSNVGKSTFINRFLNRKNLARVSTTPGKTRVLNFYLINSCFYFVDVPGYGYAKVSKVERQLFGEMIEKYLTEREELQFACLLVDFKVGPTEDDILMYDFLKHCQIKTIIVATKKDKVKNSAQHVQKNKILDKLKFSDGDEFIAYGKDSEKEIQVIRDLLFKNLVLEEV